MSLKCGIVGLPNVGKSTLFNALTKAGVAAENYPFCTIDPSVGVVEVPDKRLTQLSAIVKPQRVVPAVTEFVDIAGLVAGASKVVMLGYDCQKTGGRTHWHGDHPRTLGNAHSMPGWPKLFAKVAKFAEARRVPVVNATRETALTCFPRVDLEAALQ